MGDQALTTVARVIASSLRSYDCTARWGGEEFLVLLPQCNADALRMIGERVRVAVERLVLPCDDGAITLTVSLGGYLSASTEDQDAMFRKADSALYDAKKAGRNRLCVFAALPLETMTPALPVHAGSPGL